MFNLLKIVQEIEDEAGRRLKNDPICPGGKTTKLYAVAMEIDSAVGKLMKNENEEEK